MGYGEAISHGRSHCLGLLAWYMKSSVISHGTQPSFVGEIYGGFAGHLSRALRSSSMPLPKWEGASQGRPGSARRRPRRITEVLQPPARLAWVMPFGESGPRGLVQPQQSASSLAPAPGVRRIGQDTRRPVLGQLGKRPALSRADDTSRLWRLVPWERVSATSSSSVGDAPGATEDACFAGADACAG